MKEIFQFVEKKEGHEANFVSHYELNPETLQQLSKHVGKDVEFWSSRETWCYISPYAEEDHTSSETHAFGTLIEASEKGIVLDIKTGVINYGNLISAIPSGEKEYPYRREQFQLRRYAEVSGIDKLSVGDQTFQFGKAAVEEERQA